MLRTNQPFSDYFDKLYSKQPDREQIALKSYEKGDKILIQNETSTSIMLIRSGITKCYFVEENNKEYIVEFLGKGEILGEIEVIKNIPCLCTVEAMTEVTVYSMSAPNFRNLLKKNVKLNTFLLNVFADRIVPTSSRVSYLQLRTKEHTQSQLMELKSKEMEISKKEMAAYLGITVKNLNKTLDKIKENNSDE